MTAVVRLVVAVVAVWASIAYSFLWVLYPVVAALVGSHCAVAGAALWGRHRIAGVLREVNGWLSEDIEARKLADQRADRNYVRLTKAGRP